MIINSISYLEIIRRKVIFQNDFEYNNLNIIYGNKISYFNNANLISDLNRDGLNVLFSKIENLFKSLVNFIYIIFYYELHQPNASNKNRDEQFKYEESWTLKNLVIRAIK